MSRLRRAKRHPAKLAQRAIRSLADSAPRLVVGLRRNEPRLIYTAKTELDAGRTRVAKLWLVELARACEAAISK